MTPHKPKQRRRNRSQGTRPTGDLERLRQKLIHGPFGASQVVIEPEGEVRMSDALADFVSPYAASASSRQDYQALLTVGVVAWNAALLPADRRQDMLDDLLRKTTVKIPTDIAQDVRALINALIARKEAHFAANRRAIIDFTLRETDDGYHLSVGSTLNAINPW